jgi:HEPN domain-containing protein
MLIQGCGLASTAIEKYLKAWCAHLKRPVPRTHAVARLYSEIKKHTSNAFVLNDGFLLMLEKVYGLRYPDDLPNGFNVALNEMKILAELDRTVFEITNSFTFDEGTSEFVLTKAVRTGDERYLTKNVIANPERAAEWFGSSSQCVEFRRQDPLIHETRYLTPGLEDDGRFDEAVALLVPGQVIKTAFPRGPGRTTLKQMFNWPK